MTSDDLRCPRCGSHTRHGADWCTLCYADLRPPAEPEPEPEPVVELLLDPELGGDPVEIASSRRGKHARKNTSYDEKLAPATPAEDADLSARADAMLAMLAAESTQPLGSWTRYLDTKASRAVVIVGGLSAVTLLVFLVMTILGSML